MLMKKMLLCALAMAAVCATANAEEWTLEVGDATDIQGTLVDEKPAEGTSNGTGKHYQPLLSLKIGDTSFTFTNNDGKNEPAYYYPMSTNENGTKTIRLYVSNSMTVTAAKEFAKITGYNGKTATEVYNGEKTTTCTFSATASVRFDKFVFSDEPGAVTPPVTGDVTVKKATEFAAGEVAFVFNEGYVETFAESSKFGYWMAVAGAPADEMKVTNNAIFTIASTDKGYTIKDAYNRFMGWDGQHWSFNAYATSDEGNCYWDVTMVDGKVKIVNKAKSTDGNEVYLAGKTYNSDYEMCPTDRADQVLPMLYTKTGGGDTPNPPVTEKVNFEKATTLETGSYVFVCDGKLGMPVAQNANYGRISLSDTEVTGNVVETEETNAFSITVADGKATIVDTYGRFYSMDAQHFTSFQLYTEENAGNYWTFEMVDGNVKFTNAMNTDCIICQSKGDQGTFYTNIAPAKSPAEFNLPALYKKADQSGIADVVVEENASAVYYNLQGVRVENPTKGLYIVVKGGKSQKVAF